MVDYSYSSAGESQAQTCSVNNFYSSLSSVCFVAQAFELAAGYRLLLSSQKNCQSSTNKKSLCISTPLTEDLLKLINQSDEVIWERSLVNTDSKESHKVSLTIRHLLEKKAQPSAGLSSRPVLLFGSNFIQENVST